ncbi:ABC transporter ATP-binding protein [Oleiphilus messinensis]|uniref:ABC transporter ATP-binding protein n=1 Tax=Oleiphilus messinensis TaxID=141451 RepID=A0A1Y0I2D9_9GAMM|nr:ATP-binding cassette domain-containing protein [Oleiphilus messinensis]ARU54632.1 ABC transporter ATP-binding protein [Oleiphilus messinensis]
MIQLKNVSLRLGQHCVLGDINASIGAPGLTAIIGPNGAGKSSLLSVMSRLQPPTEGIVLLDGKNLHDLPGNTVAKQLSLLRQENHLVSRLTVADLVCFGRFPYHKGRPGKSDWEKIQQCLTLLELDSIRHRYLDQLSGGQKQRAFIAMILAQDTPYILLDEPLNNLDMKHGVAIMKTLKKAAKTSQKRVIMVLHDINFASVYCDFIVAMQNGGITHQGRTEEIMDSAVLSDIYQMSMRVEEFHQQRICFYYQ